MDLAIYDFAVAAIQQAVTNVYEFSSKFSIGSDTPGSATIVLVRIRFCLLSNSAAIQGLLQPSHFRIFFRFFATWIRDDRLNCEESEGLFA